eukprot:5768764-Heterocapsa_arctica.AAC.1
MIVKVIVVVVVVVVVAVVVIEIVAEAIAAAAAASGSVGDSGSVRACASAWACRASPPRARPVPPLPRLLCFLGFSACLACD